MPEKVDPRKLFERVKDLWPESVEFSDDPQKAVNELYWPLEECLGHHDEWLSLGAWAFYQATSKFAAEKDRSALTFSEVPFETFDRYMRMNLADASWDQWRPLYGNPKS